jgi:hypothetical protein
MNKFKIIVLWVLVIILCITIYNYGKVKYYWYEDTEEPGWGHLLKTYQGENLGQNSTYADGEKYKYDGIRYKFEKDAELRTIIIISIIAASFFFSFKINKS